VIRPGTLHWKVEDDDGPENDKDKVPHFIDPGGSGKRGDICKIAKNRDDSNGGHSYEYTGCYGGKANDPWRPLAGLHRRTTHFQSYLSQIALSWDADESQGSSQPNPSMGCVPSLGNNGDNCPQPWDNHGEAGTNFLFGDGSVRVIQNSIRLTLWEAIGTRAGGEPVTLDF
jgi:prepilin-type processing-associated H-X9-DG protein